MKKRLSRKVGLNRSYGTAFLKWLMVDYALFFLAAMNIAVIKAIGKSKEAIRPPIAIAGLLM